MKRRPFALAAMMAAGATVMGCASDAREESRSAAFEGEAASSAVSSAETPVARASEASGDSTGPATDPRAVRIDISEVPWAVPLRVDLDRMVRQQSGLYTQVLADGRGPRAQPGDSMQVHYRVWLPNGRLLDGSYEHDPPNPVSMRLGVTPFIDGWTEGVTGMRVGERRRLIVPHDLAYGPAGTPGVPPYSPLLYEVELVSLTPGPAPGDGD